jgi:quercetin dioxygenase-like cupin family protein
VHVTRNGAGVRFQPSADHRGVRPLRLHGREAGATDQLVITRSEFTVGASVDPGPVSGETVYYLLSGELTLEADGQQVTLQPGDSVLLKDGTVRSLETGSIAATVLVVRAQ